MAGLFASSRFRGTHFNAACYLHLAPKENTEYLLHAVSFTFWEVILVVGQKNILNKYFITNSNIIRTLTMFYLN